MTLSQSIRPITTLLLITALSACREAPMPDSVTGDWVDAAQGTCPIDPNARHAWLRIREESIDIQGFNCRPIYVDEGVDESQLQVEMGCETKRNSNIPMTMYFNLRAPDAATVGFKTRLNHVTPSTAVKKCPEEK